MTLNKPIRYSVVSDNPTLYKDRKLQYGTYTGFSEGLQRTVTFVVHTSYWSGGFDSSSGIYDNETVTHVVGTVTQREWNNPDKFLPIIDCTKISDSVDNIKHLKIKG